MFNLLSLLGVKRSFSQSGEDLILDYYLNKSSGFYVDIGANDPVQFSNTAFFYSKGWKGINIEPNPVIFKKINSNRSRDINLNIGISKKKEQLPFYIFEAHTLSTFSEEQKKLYQKHYALKETKNIECYPLDSVLDKYAKKQDIDFFSVDVEGLDLSLCLLKLFSTSQ
jgi:FkbM family methyltransferase